MAKPEVTRLQVNIRKTTHDALANMANAELLSLAVVVRRALDEYVKNAKKVS